MKRRNIWFYGSLSSLLLTLYLWMDEPGFVAWFSGVAALLAVTLALRFEHHPKMDQDFLGILAVVPAVLSAAIALGQWKVVGSSGPLAALPGVLGLILWWTRPRNP